MSGDSRHSERSVERIDYAILHSTGDRVVQISDNLTSTADNQPPTELQESPEPSVDDTTHLDRIELTSDTEDQQSVSSNESSTITPASSDTSSHDITLTPDRITLIPDSHTSPSTTANRSDLNSQLVDALDEIKDTYEMTEVKEIFARINLLVEDLRDYIDENSMHDAYITVEDIDEHTKRVEEMRSRYRELHRCLRDLVGETEYETQYSPKFEKNLTEIKNYIKEGKTKKSSIRSSKDSIISKERQAQVKKDNEVIVQKEASSKFLLSEIERLILVLDEVFAADNKTASNDEIKLREDNLSENLLEADRLSDKFQKLLETIPESYPRKAHVLHELTISYNAVMTKKFQ